MNKTERRRAMVIATEWLDDKLGELLMSAMEECGLNADDHDKNVETAAELSRMLAAKIMRAS